MVDDSGEKQGRGFKVEDRRRFSPEGELKPEYRREDKSTAGTGPAEEKREPQRQTQQGSPGRVAPLEITFGTFVVSLSTQALISLGEIADPNGGRTETDLAAAEQLIDIIGMLQQKTRGNLDADEEKLLTAVLFDLRLKYVERARQQASP
ncbi:MAG: DUF1844 domain-containing protein [Deltaproteobacteria bacterium]|jgi:hypothetical protein|nr:DUF1844 domain-containing protein [Deltaproteobacteria bacterium]